MTIAGHTFVLGWCSCGTPWTRCRYADESFLGKPGIAHIGNLNETELNEIRAETERENGLIAQAMDCAIRIAAALILSMGIAFAAPPAGSDPLSPMAQWYGSLTIPGGSLKGYKCCDLADCRPVRYKAVGDHFEAWIDSATFPDAGDTSNEGHAPNAWVKVPDEVIIRGKENPNGEAVLCWFNREIRCFVPGAAI